MDFLAIPGRPRQHSVLVLVPVRRASWAVFRGLEITMPRYIVKFRKKGSVGRGSEFAIDSPSVSEAWDRAQEAIPPEHEVIDVVPKGDHTTGKVLHQY